MKTNFVGAMTLGITTFGITTRSVEGLIVTLSLKGAKDNAMLTVIFSVVVLSNSVLSIFSYVECPGSWGHIHITSYSFLLINRHNKLECSSLTSLSSLL